MPEIGSITRQKPIELTVKLDEEDSVNLRFDRNKITPAWIERSQGREEEQDVLALPRMLAEVLISWDVSEDGKEFAPTAENLARLPYVVQAQILELIIPASMPSRAEGEASSGLSSSPASASTETSVTSPNGPLTSESPVPSASPSPT